MKINYNFNSLPLLELDENDRNNRSNNSSSNNNNSNSSDNKILLYKNKWYNKSLLMSGNINNPFKCPECNPSRNYKSLINLKSHYKIHTSSAYKCKLCKFKTTRPKQLIEHSRVHTGERPFKCNICMKSFKHKHTLSTHSRIHTGERPYKCSSCNKGFKVKHNLIKHSLIHNENRTMYWCMFCSKHLKSIEGKKGHAYKYHNGDESCFITK